MTNYFDKYPILYKVLDFIILNGNSNNLPYHGIDHVYTVFENAALYLNNYSLNFDNQLLNEKELLIGSLFHDYNHSGGEYTDNINILNAINGLTQFHNLHSDFNLDIAKYIIQSTEYPYVMPDEDLTAECKIIRDADMSYLFSSLAFVKFYGGLRVEMKMDIETFTNMQKKFMNNITFYTPFFQNMWDKNKNLRLKEIEQFTLNR